MLRRWLLSASLVICACLADGTSAARNLSVVELLDRYAAGQFDAVVAELAGDVNFEELLNQLKRDGPGWIAAGGAAAEARRQLVAATFALEAARVDSWTEWKWIQKQPSVMELQLLNVLYWKPPPLLIEWACELFRKDEVPHPIERWWQLAALSVAQRSEDPQFLVGDTAIGRDFGAGEIMNTQKEIKHLDHVMKRFPNEPRFMLGQGIARDRFWVEDALQAYSAVEGDADVGGEALMRLGAMIMKRQNGVDGALKAFDRAEAMTRDPYVVYLVHFFRAQIFERRRQMQHAEAAYRTAVAAIPRAQSATVALAALLFNDDRRAEAYALTGSLLTPEPMPPDPWREYVHADDRFWPLLITKLRTEIRK
jgi:tetratricopeptide (TPR) repeat protein